MPLTKLTREIQTRFDFKWKRVTNRLGTKGSKLTLFLLDDEQKLKSVIDVP